MRDYIIRRLLLLPVIIFGVTFLTFVAYRVIPGNAADLTCGIDRDPDCKANVEKLYGLDRPFLIQYGDWVFDVAKGDLGTSLLYRTKVKTELGRRLPVT